MPVTGLDAPSVQEQGIHVETEVEDRGMQKDRADQTPQLSGADEGILLDAPTGEVDIELWSYDLSYVDKDGDGQDRVSRVRLYLWYGHLNRLGLLCLGVFLPG